MHCSLDHDVVVGVLTFIILLYVVLFGPPTVVYILCLFIFKFDLATTIIISLASGIIWIIFLVKVVFRD